MEHRALKLSQLEHNRRPDHYMYTENVSKNRNRSFKQLCVKNKTVPVYACPDVGVKCPVNLLEQYISKLASKAVENDILYVRLLEEVSPDPSVPWYSAVPVGKHTLTDKVKNMCNMAGIYIRKQN